MTTKKTIGIILAGLGAISITVFGGLMSEIISPISEQIKDKLLSAAPNTTIMSARYYDGVGRIKEVIDGGTISTRGISFELEANPTTSIFKEYDKYDEFECSFDGSPFEPCISPKSYDNLGPDTKHIFKVRAKGLLGNTDDTPDKHEFTPVTSAVVEGVIANYNRTVEVGLGDSENITTDHRGGFFLENITRGPHYLHIYTSPEDLPYVVSFPVPDGTQWKDLGIISINNVSRINTTTQTEITDNRINQNYTKINATEIGKTNYVINLIQEGNLITMTDEAGGNAKYFTKIYIKAPKNTLDKVENVTYYLHPTFNPSIITATSPGNNYAISFTGWGVFDLKAHVFVEGETEPIELTLNKKDWKFNQGLT